MFTKSSFILFKLIKVYGITSVLSDTLFSVVQTMEVDLTLLVSTFIVEGIFVSLKSFHIEVPMWIEAMQDLL